MPPLHINSRIQLTGYEGYNEKARNLKCKGSKTVLGNYNGDLDSSIHECTMKENCKAVFNHGCNGKNFYACRDVEINRGISAGCTYRKSKYRYIQAAYQNRQI